MKILIHWLITAVAIVAAAYILPGVHVAGFVTALIVAVVLGLINTFIRPIVAFVTLPITILTLGLFAFVVNAVMVLLAAHFVSGFVVDSFVSALEFSIILAVVHGVLSLFVSKE